MKNVFKGLVKATIIVSGLFLFSCESDEIQPERFADDPPANNTPQKPPQP